MDVVLDRSIADPWAEGMVMGGSSDVSEVSWNVPTLEFNTTARVLGTPGHSWQVVAQSGMGIGHKSLIFAAKVIATSTIELLVKPEIVQKAQKEFKIIMKERTYNSYASEKPPLDIWSRVRANEKLNSLS